MISELIHYTAAGNSDGVSANMPLIQVIVPQVMNLKAQLSDSTKVNNLLIYNLHVLGHERLTYSKAHWDIFSVVLRIVFSLGIYLMAIVKSNVKFKMPVFCL